MFHKDLNVEWKVFTTCSVTPLQNECDSYRSWAKGELDTETMLRKKL